MKKSKYYFLSVCLALNLFSLQVDAKSPTSFNDPAASIVGSLYRDYAWEVVFLNSVYTELIDQPKEKLEKYFSPELAALFLKDRACKEKTGDVCHLDFDPIFASQDRASVHDLEIEDVKVNNDVKVLFKNSASAPAIELHFKMVNTPKGWRIDDIIYGQGKSSLKRILNQ